MSETSKGRRLGRGVTRLNSDLPRARQGFEMGNLLLTITGAIWGSLGWRGQSRAEFVSNCPASHKAGPAWEDKGLDGAGRELAAGPCQTKLTLASGFLSLGPSFPICQEGFGLALIFFQTVCHTDR